VADSVKVLIAERNGVDLPYKEEYDLRPENIPFTDSTFDATDTFEAIVEARNSGLPGPVGPQGEPGTNALRYSASFTNQTVVAVPHSFGKVPIDNVVETTFTTSDRSANAHLANTIKCGPGTSASATTKVDPSTYSRSDDAALNTSTFTFAGPISGIIVVLA
jgi:hypothetical protein